jgi:transketolase
MVTSDFDRESVAVIRGLAVDAPAKAKSGHQGTALALAPLAHVLWSRVMKFDPADPQWFDRDRFVLSAGHASILQYSMLFLAGYGVSLDDLEQFRQWGSNTPGHPEVGHTPGVEVTTGPLGQGFANAVGLALAERRLRAVFGSDLCDHHTWVIASDGDLSEGISHEAASLAGRQGLDRLVVVYDNNHITIDGPTELALADDVVGRFVAYGWNVIDAGEIGEHLDALEGVLNQAKGHTGQPTLISLRSHIGFPSPKWTDSPAAHGLCFDAESITQLKTTLGIPDTPFYAPEELVDQYRKVCARGAADRTAWSQRRDASPEKADFEAMLSDEPTSGVATAIADAVPSGPKATRVASNAVIDGFAAELPSLVIGSADLSGNTGTRLRDAVFASAEEPGGRQIHYGIREHAMGAAAVGMALHGGVYPIVGTFLVFSDYMRPAVRLAALSGARCAFVWSHDSVAVGEDGPTHQPVEHVMSLRAIPDLYVVRPADSHEVAAMWQWALGHDGPVAAILSRQNVPELAGTADRAGDGLRRGAYVLVDADEPQVVLVGTGSEVALAVQAATQLSDAGVAARVVSMPCWELFEAAGPEYRHEVLPPGVPVVSIEAGVTLGWHRWADACVGSDRFGASAPGDVVMEHLGITANAVVDAAQGLLS